MAAAASQARSDLGPLMTAWQAPASCSHIIAECDTCADVAKQAQSCGRKDGLRSDDPDCWPPRATYIPPALSSPPPGPSLSGWGFYSPGLACPTGYVPACSQTADSVTGNFDFQFPLIPHETGVGCCPSGYTCAHTGGRRIQTCESVATSGAVVQTGTCNAGVAATGIVFNPKTIPFVATITSAPPQGPGGPVNGAGPKPVASTVTAYTVQAPMFQLVYQSTDPVSFAGEIPPTTTPPPPNVFVTTDATGGTVRVTASPPPWSTGSASSGSSSGGMSAGAAAGVGVGVALGVALVGFLAFLFFRSRRRHAAAESSAELDGDNNNNNNNNAKRGSDDPSWTSSPPMSAATMTTMTGGIGAPVSEALGSPVSEVQGSPVSPSTAQTELAGSGEHVYAELSTTQRLHDREFNALNGTEPAELG